MKKKTRWKFPIHHFFNETYLENIYLLNGVSAQELTAFVRVQFEDDSYENPANFAGRCVFSEGSKGTIIALREKYQGKPSQIAILAHECFHAAEYMLEARGVRHGQETTEVYAYLLGSILRQCLERLTQKSGK